MMACDDQIKIIVLYSSYELDHQIYVLCIHLLTMTNFYVICLTGHKLKSEKLCLKKQKKNNDTTAGMKARRDPHEASESMAPGILLIHTENIAKFLIILKPVQLHNKIITGIDLVKMAAIAQPLFRKITSSCCKRSHDEPNNKI